MGEIFQYAYEYNDHFGYDFDGLCYRYHSFSSFPQIFSVFQSLQPFLSLLFHGNR